MLASQARWVGGLNTFLLFLGIVDSSIIISVTCSNDTMFRNIDRDEKIVT